MDLINTTEPHSSTHVFARTIFPDFNPLSVAIEKIIFKYITEVEKKAAIDDTPSMGDFFFFIYQRESINRLLV